MDGPALNPFHSTRTSGANAFSKAPFARPTSAWACVMLGKCPTRMTLLACAVAKAVTKRVMEASDSRSLALLIYAPSQRQTEPEFGAGKYCSRVWPADRFGDHSWLV